jgi:hypothetical protein
VSAGSGGAIIFALFLLNIEIADFFSLVQQYVQLHGDWLRFDLHTTGLCLVALLGAGIIIRSRPARIACWRFWSPPSSNALSTIWQDWAASRIMSFVGFKRLSALVARAPEVCPFSAQTLNASSADSRQSSLRESAASDSAHFEVLQLFKPVWDDVSFLRRRQRCCAR